MTSVLRERSIGSMFSWWTSQEGRFSARALSLTAPLALLLAVLGVGAPGAGLWVRTIEVLFVEVTGFWLGLLVSRRLLMARSLAGRRWVRWTVLAVVMAPPMAVLSWLVDALFAGAPPTSGGFLFSAKLWLVASPAGCLMMALLPVSGAEPAADAGTRRAERPPVAFLRRLPPRLRGATLYAVEAQDHYVRLHTSKGRDLILVSLTPSSSSKVSKAARRTARGGWRETPWSMCGARMADGCSACATAARFR